MRGWRDTVRCVSRERACLCSWACTTLSCSCSMPWRGGYDPRKREMQRKGSMQPWLSLDKSDHLHLLFEEQTSPGAPLGSRAAGLGGCWEHAGV